MSKDDETKRENPTQAEPLGGHRLVEEITTTTRRIYLEPCRPQTPSSAPEPLVRRDAAEPAPTQLDDCGCDLPDRDE